MVQRADETGGRKGSMNGKRGRERNAVERQKKQKKRRRGVH